jgi:hypothetical protein
MNRNRRDRENRIEDVVTIPIPIPTLDQPDGRATMLGHWRVVLKQAEEAARAGRYDEALALSGRPDVAEFRQAVQLRARLTRELIDRAVRRAEAEDLDGAIVDLALAEVHHAPPDALAAARRDLAVKAAGDIERALQAAEPSRAVERVAALARHRISDANLRRLKDAAEAWIQARREMRAGEFTAARDALERASRLAGDAAGPELAAALREVEARQQAVHPKVERLYEALGAGRWSEVLAAAEAVLDQVPEHPAAREARARAWRQIGAVTPGRDLAPRRGMAAAVPSPNPTLLVIADEARPRPGPAQSDSPHPAGERFLLWADDLGGYLLCTGDEVVLGRACPDGQADVPLLGDVSRRHASIVRNGEGYVIRAYQATYVNNRKVETAPLRHGDVIRLGGSVELEFRQPSPVSTTARLEIISRHRLPVAVDGVILMAETCLIGPSKQSHILAPDLAKPVVLIRGQDQFWCKAHGSFEVDGRSRTGRSPLSSRSSVVGEGFSFSLEPFENRPDRA